MFFKFSLKTKNNFFSIYCDSNTSVRASYQWQPCLGTVGLYEAMARQPAQTLPDVCQGQLLQTFCHGWYHLLYSPVCHAPVPAECPPCAGVQQPGRTPWHGLVAKVADLGLSRILKQQATHRTTRTVCGSCVGDHCPFSGRRSSRRSSRCSCVS